MIHAVCKPDQTRSWENSISAEPADSADPADPADQADQADPADQADQADWLDILHNLNNLGWKIKQIELKAWKIKIYPL